MAIHAVRILLVQSKQLLLPKVSEVLERENARVFRAHDAESALERMGQIRPDLIVTHTNVRCASGAQFVDVLAERLPDIPVILFTESPDPEAMLRPTAPWVVKVLVKPYQMDANALALEIRDILDRLDVQQANRRQSKGRLKAHSLIGKAPTMVEVYRRIAGFACSSVPVLITGETGTGKEVVARKVHDMSEHRTGPFLGVNCAALPETLLESALFGHKKGAFTGAIRDQKGAFAEASNGTVFLDEVGDTTPNFQAKLLRVLQERLYTPIGSFAEQPVHARVIAATNQDLHALVLDHRFRGDLYHRLNVAAITVPPLRDRMEDLQELVEYLVARSAKADGRVAPALGPGVLELLRSYHWPGNIRELDNVTRRAAALATIGVLLPRDIELNTSVQSGATPIALDEAIRKHVQSVLALADGNKSRAARILKITRKRLNRIIA